MCGKQPFYLLLCTLCLTGFGIDHNYHLIAILVQTLTYLRLSFVHQKQKACDLSRLFDLNLTHARKDSKCPLGQLHLTPELWFKHGSKLS